VVAEKNFGGDMVESTLRAGNVKARVVLVTASRGKQVRAEPVAALYDQGRIRHKAQFPLMEAEMLMTTPAGYQGEESPNRMDALVWAITELKPEQDSYDRARHRDAVPGLPPHRLGDGRQAVLQAVHRSPTTRRSRSPART
jgi:phage terminase large subunit-like protein